MSGRRKEKKLLEKLNFKLIDTSQLTFNNIIDFLGRIEIIIGILLGFVLMLKEHKPELFRYRYWILNILFALFFAIILTYAIKYRSSGITKMRASSIDFYGLMKDTQEISLLMKSIKKEYRTKHKNDERKRMSKAGVVLLTNEFKHYSERFLNRIVEVMNAYTGTDVSACIKIVTDFEGPDNESVVSFARNITANDERKRKDRSNRRERIRDNSDFSYIYYTEKPIEEVFFYEQNLLKYEEDIDIVTGGRMKYKNTTSQWEKYYKGTMVVPIVEGVDNLSINEYNVIGFLCVDSLSTRAFTMNQQEINVKLLQGYAKMYGMALEKYIKYLYM